MFYGSVGRVGLRALLAATAYTPASLFAAGEQGVWLDNSDFTTLFQDAAGTTPVTGYEQFVGLRLDKSKGLVLGSELLGNPSFNSSANYSLFAGATISGGQLSIDNQASSRAEGTGNFLPTGKWLQVEIDIASTSGSISVLLADAGGALTIDGGSYSSAGVFRRYVYSAATNGNFRIIRNSGATVLNSISFRELPGNHAYQTTTTARAVLSARYNLLTQTENQSSGVWVDYNATQQSNVGIAPNGTNTADRIVESNGVSFQTRYQSIAGGLNIEYTVSAYAKADQRNVFNLSYSGTAGSNWFAATFSLTGGGSVLKTGAGANGSYTRSSITPVGDGWYLCQVTGTTGQASTHYIYPGPSDTTNPTYQSFGLLSYSGNSANGIFVWGVDVRVANESSALPAYQRVGAAVNGTSTSIGTPDYDTVGFPAYLRYDGGDWYQTNSIDFSTGATNPPLGSAFTASSWANAGTTWDVFSSAGGSFTAEKTTAGGNDAAISDTFPVTLGSFYQITLVVSATTLSAYSVGINSGTNGRSTTASFSGTGTKTALVQANVASGNFSISVFTAALGSITVTSASVKAISDTNYYPDKMSVFSGVRKLSDAVQVGVIAELSQNIDVNNGCFALLAPRFSAIANSSQWLSKGTVAASVNYDSFTTPSTRVFACSGDISGDAAIFRQNGTVAGTSSADQGTGTFGNYPLYIGARGAGPSLFFTGREYETIVLGRAVTATELANTENYMEAQTFGKDMQYVYADELTTATGDFITAADGDQIYMTVQYV